METPYTPAVPLFLALREACLIIEEEGIASRIARHQKMAQAVRAAVNAWGFSLFPKIDANARIFQHGHRGFLSSGCEG